MYLTMKITMISLLYYSDAFSGWIGNLGVVPLFLLFAFLTTPDFFFLLFLLFFVTLVLETIIYPLISLIYIFLKKIKHYYLSHQSKKVNLRNTFQRTFLKKLIVFIIIITNSPVRSAQTLSKPGNIILAKGEIIEIYSKNIKTYSFGNSSIISHKYNIKKKSFIIKAKKIGYTQLIIWHKKNKTKSIFDIYILSKKDHLNNITISKLCNQIGLKTKNSSQYITISGTLLDLESYKIYINLLKNKRYKILSKVNLSQKLKNNLIGIVYYHFLNNLKIRIRCISKDIYIHCFIPFNKKIPKSISKYLKELNIKIFETKDNQHLKNYLVSLKLIQIEKVDGSEFSLGLNEIKLNLNNLFLKPLKNIIDSKFLYLSSMNIQLSTLAEPEVLTLLNKKTTIKMGQEVLIKKTIQPLTNNETDTSYEWTFMGIKLDFKINQEFNKNTIEYETTFKRPISNKRVSNSKSKSKIYIKKNEPIKLFEINIKTSNQQINSIPILSDIPILKNIFQSKNNQKTFKKIICFLKIKEEKQ
jgi:hypothetical protein